MALTTTLAACNTNPALNGPDGATDLPSTMDDQLRLALSFIAQVRDGAGLSAPPGVVQAFAGITIPTNWLACNGAAVSRTTYAALFGVIGTTYGIGDGATTFNVPDLRAMFLRGYDAGRGIDTGRVYGSQQGDSFASHTHGVTDGGHGHTASSGADGVHNHGVNDPGHNHVWGTNDVNAAGAGAGAPRSVNATNITANAFTGISLNNSPSHTHPIAVNPGVTGISIQSTGSTETRPDNVAMHFIIKT